MFIVPSVVVAGIDIPGDRNISGLTLGLVGYTLTATHQKAQCLNPYQSQDVACVQVVRPVAHSWPEHSEILGPAKSLANFKRVAQAGRQRPGTLSGSFLDRTRESSERSYRFPGFLTRQLEALASPWNWRSLFNWFPVQGIRRRAELGRNWNT